MKNLTVKIITANSNQRHYPKKVLLNAIETAKSLISQQRLFVANACPPGPEIPIMSIIGVVQKLDLKEDGVYATVKFLNTAAYADFEKTVANIPNINLINSFSAIGLGTTKKNKNKIEVIQSDYELNGVYLK